jgi:hypothetical protein
MLQSNPEKVLEVNRDGWGTTCPTMKKFFGKKFILMGRNFLSNKRQMAMGFLSVV